MNWDETRWNEMKWDEMKSPIWRIFATVGNTWCSEIVNIKYFTIKIAIDLNRRKFVDNLWTLHLRAGLPKINGKNVHAKFCFYKIHVSLDLGIKTKPDPPIQMGGHAPRGYIAWPAHFHAISRFCFWSLRMKRYQKSEQYLKCSLAQARLKSVQ